MLWRAPMADPGAETPSKGEDDKDRHLHIRVSDERSSIFDFITEYLHAAGKTADWYWRTAGRLEGNEAENLEELLSSAFEAGAFISHEHPEDLHFLWVTEEECEKERKREERGEQREAARKDRSTLPHYA